MSSFMDNTWTAELLDMQLTNRKKFAFYCVIYIFSKIALVIFLKGETITF